jgi:outer membrane protein OmpA-like peptidoglycan-associated protein
LVLALTLIVPLFAFLLAMKDEFFDHSLWSETCTLRVPFKGLLLISCAKLRILSFALLVIGAFGIVVLVWWFLNELIGLRRIFEVPWFGVGDDVETVGVIESVVRAALFLLTVWISLGLCVMAFAGMTGGVDGKKMQVVGPDEPKAPIKNPPDGRPPPGPTVTVDLTPLIAAANALTVEVKGIREKTSTTDLAPITAVANTLTAEVKGIRDQLASRPPPSGGDAAVLGELQKLGDSLKAIHAVLKTQDEKLAALGPIERELAQWDPEKSHAALLEETKRLGGKLGDIRDALETQGKKLAALNDIEQFLRHIDTAALPAIKVDVDGLVGAVGEVRKTEREQVVVLERIERLLQRREPISETPPTGCLARGNVANAARDAATHARTPTSAMRTVTVFFDRADGGVTPGAKASLRDLAAELRAVDAAEVTVHGSADLQGDRELNRQFALQRAQVVKEILERDVPQLQQRIRISSERSTDPPPSEPYNRIARVEASWPCP